MDTGRGRPACLFIMVTLRHAAASHIGLVYDHNEDSYIDSGRLLAVADGVGGAAAGEVASALVVEALTKLNRAKATADPGEALRRAVDEANNNIGVAADENSDYRGMATTVTALLFTESRLDVAHAGDSRAFRFRGGELTRLTKDDSYIQALLDEGAITPEEAATHPYRSVVTKVLQGYPTEPDLQTLEAELGDRYLVCSDGLSDVVSEPDIAVILDADAELPQLADRLVEAALAGGGPDNVTVVLGEVVESAGGLRGKISGAVASVFS